MAMRRIGGVGPAGPLAGRPGARGAGGFRLGAPGRAAAATGAALAGISGGLLALQEAAEAPARDAAAGRRATAMLEELDGLLLEMLSGPVDPGRLARLATLESGEEGADPDLREAVQGIALRAKVELARRERGVLATPV